MAENILKKLVNNSQIAIDDGVYDVDVNLKKSNQDFKQIFDQTGIESPTYSQHQFFLQYQFEFYQS